MDFSKTRPPRLGLRNRVWFRRGHATKRRKQHHTPKKASMKNKRKRCDRRTNERKNIFFSVFFFHFSLIFRVPPPLPRETYLLWVLNMFFFRPPRKCLFSDTHESQLRGGYFLEQHGFDESKLLAGRTSHAGHVCWGANNGALRSTTLLRAE